MKPLVNFGRTVLAYLKTPELVYSLGLMVLIPVAITINTIVIISRFTSVIDSQLRDRAAVNANLLKHSFDQTDPKAVQTKIDGISQSQINGEHYFRRLDYFIHADKGEAFKLLASSDKDSISGVVKPEADANTSAESSDPRSFTQLNLTWSERKDIIIAAIENGQQGYRISTLIEDPRTHERIAVVAAFISFQFIDDLTRKAYLTSGILLTIITAIVLALLFIRSRIYRYSTLFKRLQEIDQMKDEFISIASHELRTPLTSIRGNLSMLLEEHDITPEQQHKLIENAERSTAHLTSLVADLLDVSRIEQGRVQLRPERIKVTDVLKEVMDAAEPGAKAKGLELIVVPHEEMYVTADRQKFQQVLTNIIGNAIKYTQQGRVQVSVEPDKDHVAITVSDTGIGMSPEDRGNLFKKFYRIRNTETEKISGTGLGLWITKSLIEMMGGQIFVDSIKNSGTQVKFTLPQA